MRWVRINSWGKKKSGKAVVIGVAAALLAYFFLPMADVGFVAPVTVGKDTFTITVGNEVNAAADADYICDGTDDDIQLQLALDDLPTQGGKIIVLAGNYSLSATVARVIDSVTIEGLGPSTSFSNDGVTAIFSAGGQSGWTFRNFTTDAGGVNVAGASNYLVEDVLIGAVYFTRYTDTVVTLRPSADTDDYITFGTNGEDVPSIYGTGAYLRVGDAGITGHGLNAEDDLMVTGEMEVDGVAYFDSDVIISTANGIDVNPGSDIDADLITVGVTGTPRLFWDESENRFALTHGLIPTNATTDLGVTAHSWRYLNIIQGINIRKNIANFTINSVIDAGSADHIIEIQMGGSSVLGVFGTGDGAGGIDATTLKAMAYYPLAMVERAAAGADVAGEGQVWVKDDTPNKLYFTDDTGVDHAIITGATAIKHEFFVPFEDPTGQVGNWDVVSINAVQDTHFIFQVSESFESLVNAKVVMIPDATETIQWDINVSVSAVGEAFNNDDRSAVDQTLAVTADQITEVDISGQLAGLVGGDYVAIDFLSDIADLRIIGFEFDYN